MEHGLNTDDKYNHENGKVRKRENKGCFRDFFRFTFSCSSLSVFHPWLKIDEIISAQCLNDAYVA